MNILYYSFFVDGMAEEQVAFITDDEYNMLVAYYCEHPEWEADVEYKGEIHTVTLHDIFASDIVPAMGNIKDISADTEIQQALNKLYSDIKDFERELCYG